MAKTNDIVGRILAEAVVHASAHKETADPRRDILLANLDEMDGGDEDLRRHHARMINQLFDDGDP